MQHEIPAVRLPRSDGSKDIFCEASYRRVRPCQNYVKFAPDGTLLKGSVLYDDHKNAPTYFCGHHCLAWYVKGA